MLPSWIKDLTHKYLAEGREWFQTDAKNKEIITVHHTASSLNDTEEKILESIFATHNGKNGWPGFAYQYFYIPKRFTKGFSGKWLKLNNDTDVTWHDTINWDSIGVCIHGFYHPDINNTLEQEDLDNIKKMLDWLSNENPQFPATASNVFGHRDRSSTACPGNYLYPFVSEYRTKNGAVSWSTVESGDTLRLEEDIPSFVEDKYELKSKGWYSKYWTLAEFITEAIKAFTDAENYEDKNVELNKEIKRKQEIIDQNIKDFQIKNKQIEDLQLASQELTVQIGIISKEKDKTITERNTAQGELKIMTTDYSNLKTERDEVLVPTIKRLEEQRFTVGESWSFYTNALLNWRWKK